MKRFQYILHTFQYKCVCVCVCVCACACVCVCVCGFYRTLPRPLDGLGSYLGNDRYYFGGWPYLYDMTLDEKSRSPGKSRSSRKFKIFQKKFDVTHRNIRYDFIDQKITGLVKVWSCFSFLILFFILKKKKSRNIKKNNLKNLVFSTDLYTKNKVILSSELLVSNNILWQMGI